MTSRQKAYKINLIKQVHTSKMYVDVYANDDELYREFLWNTLYAKSSKELLIEELINLVSYLNGKSMELTYTKISKQRGDHFLSTWNEKARDGSSSALLSMIYNNFKLPLNSIYELPQRYAGGVENILKKIKLPIQEELRKNSLNKLRLYDKPLSSYVKGNEV